MSTSTLNLCCSKHCGDTNANLTQTLSSMYRDGALFVTGGQPVPWGKGVSFKQFAPTQALKALAAQRSIPTRNADGSTTLPTALKVSTLKLCKQHSTSVCKLGAMCRNIHLCKEVYGNPSTLATSSSNTTGVPSVRCDSASRGGLKLPPLLPLAPTSSMMTSTATRTPSQGVHLPMLVMSAGTGPVPPPQRSCTSPMKSSRSARLNDVDASRFRPMPPTSSRQSAADLDDIVLVATPPPSGTPKPVIPSTVSSTGSSCFRRFAKRWNEPLKRSASGNNSLAVTPSQSVQFSSAGNSIDLEAVRDNVDLLTTAADASAAHPMPPTNASGEGRCYARRTAFETKDGFFGVFSN